MKVFVSCKQVPDVAMAISVKNGKIVEDDMNYILNAYDASSVEEALVLKEKVDDLEVSLVLVGEEKGKDALRKGLAMGADNAFHLIDPDFENKDSYSYAIGPI